MDSYTFDTIVIGGGLIGSACAKVNQNAFLQIKKLLHFIFQYLSLENRKVALIGPEEPTCRADTNVGSFWLYTVGLHKKRNDIRIYYRGRGRFWSYLWGINRPIYMA